MNDNEKVIGEATIPVASVKIDWNTKINKENCIVINGEGDKKVEFVTLKELQRLGHEKGIKDQSTQIVFCVLNKEYCAAAATATVSFNDGTSFDGSGDCTPDNADEGFNKYVTSMAESRALARALKFGLRGNDDGMGGSLK